MASGQRVLVVDESSEMADVLQAVLEPRGVRVERARSSAMGPRATIDPANDSIRLSVVVVDEESTANRAAGCDQWHNVPKVVIGTASIPADSPAPGSAPQRHLRKPFQYAELVRAIETLIAADVD